MVTAFASRQNRAEDAIHAFAHHAGRASPGAVEYLDEAHAMQIEEGRSRGKKRHDPGSGSRRIVEQDDGPKERGGVWHPLRIATVGLKHAGRACPIVHAGGQSLIQDRSIGEEVIGPISEIGAKFGIDAS